MFVMPRFNGTGPEGEGPKTGRGNGKCTKKTESQNLRDTKQDDFISGRFGVRRWLRRGNSQWRGFLNRE